jgi:hypothetical protein
VTDAAKRNIKGKLRHLVTPVRSFASDDAAPPLQKQACAALKSMIENGRIQLDERLLEAQVTKLSVLAGLPQAVLCRCFVRKNR